MTECRNCDSTVAQRLNRNTPLQNTRQVRKTDRLKKAMHRQATLKRRSAARYPAYAPIPIHARTSPRATNMSKDGCSCGGGCPACVARSLAGPDHPAEREAEAVAGRVMSMATPEAAPAVQRMTEDIPLRQPEDDEETLQRQPEEEKEEETLQL